MLDDAELITTDGRESLGCAKKNLDQQEVKHMRQGVVTRSPHSPREAEPAGNTWRLVRYECSPGEEASATQGQARHISAVLL